MKFYIVSKKIEKIYLPDKVFKKISSFKEQKTVDWSEHSTWAQFSSCAAG